MSSVQPLIDGCVGCRGSCLRQPQIRVAKRDRRQVVRWNPRFLCRASAPALAHRRRVRA